MTNISCHFVIILHTQGLPYKWQMIKWATENLNYLDYIYMKIDGVSLNMFCPCLFVFNCWFIKGTHGFPANMSVITDGMVEKQQRNYICVYGVDIYWLERNIFASLVYRRTMSPPYLCIHVWIINNSNNQKTHSSINSSTYLVKSKMNGQ